MTAELDVKRESARAKIEMALADFGYIERVYSVIDDANPDGFDIVVEESVPNAVFWQALKLADLTLPCFYCFEVTLAMMSMGDTPYYDCIAGECSSPTGPTKPTKEQLVFGPKGAVKT